MTKRKQYPDECPVFRYALDGRDYVLAPSVNEIACTASSTWFSSGDGYVVHSGSKLMQPITRAARELVQWSRQ